MLLHWGTEYLEKLLPSHLRQRIKEPRCDSNLETSDGVAPIPFLNAVTEETMAEIPLIGNRLSRRKLRKFLTEEENLNIQVSSVHPRLLTLDSDQITVWQNPQGNNCQCQFCACNV